MPVLLILKSYFSHKTDGFFLSPGAWTVVIALSGKRLRDPHDVTSQFITLRHDVITSWAKSKLPRASSRLWNEPRHEISNNVICATSEVSDQPAHTRSLIRAFASRLNFLWVLWYWLNIILSFQAWKETAQARLSLHLSKCHIHCLESTCRCSNYKSSWYPIGTTVQGSQRL